MLVETGVSKLSGNSMDRAVGACDECNEGKKLDKRS